MSECFKCGISDEKVKLFDAISRTGIVKICKNCSSEENVPVIRKPTGFQLQEPEKRQTIYEKLLSTTGIKRDISKERIPQKISYPTEQDVTLKDIVEKNLKIAIKEKTKLRKDLVDNFHWIIMRARRARHLTQKQLAEIINISELEIKMAEQGILPEHDSSTINKLEDYFGLKLLKQDFIEKVKENSEAKTMSFDPITTKNLTISDLKEMRKKKEEGIFDRFEKEEGTMEIDDFETIPEYNYMEDFEDKETPS
ncbi:MAG TPA: hypothetical protein VMZ91_16680 [Candidatus Paceibacterota bacterium]|nr:hypothetical protein [Candidatus Paceibacterota bacterium]